MRGAVVSWVAAAAQLGTLDLGIREDGCVGVGKHGDEEVNEDDR